MFREILITIAKAKLQSDFLLKDRPKFVMRTSKAIIRRGCRACEDIYDFCQQGGAPNAI